MSLAGVRSNRGDGYQTAIAVEWAITMLLDGTILAMEVDSTELVGGAPVTVDDVVVRYASKGNVYLQCKKNEPDFDSWSIDGLSDELHKVAAVLRNDPNGRVMFYSRNNFGQLGKLREHLQTQPHHQAYLKSLSAPLSKEHASLIQYFGGDKASSSDTFSLLKRVDFETTSKIERLTEKNKSMLARHVSNSQAAYSAIWTAVDQLGARIDRTDGGTHSLTRPQLFALLAEHGCEFINSPWATQSETAEHIDGFSIFQSARRAFTDTGDDSIVNWENRYKALVKRLQTQDPSSLLADAGERLQSGDYDGAQRCIDEVILDGTRSAALLGTAYASKAELQLLQFNHAAALESLKAACYWEPDNTQLTTEYCHLLIGMEQYRDVVRLLRPKLDAPADAMTKAHWHCQLGIAMLALDDSSGADKAFRNAEKLFNTAGPSSSDSRSTLVHALYVNRALLAERRGAFSQAEEHYTSAIAHFRNELGSDPRSIQVAVRLAQALNNLALLYWQTGADYDIAAIFVEATSILSNIDDWSARHHLASTKLNFGEYLTASGLFREAEPLILDSLQLRRKAMHAGQWHPATAAAFCEDLLGLGTLYLRSGRPLEALASLEEARAQVELLRHEDPVIYSVVITNYATNATAIYRDSCKFDDALDAADEAIRVLRKREQTDDVLEDLATALNNKANVLIETRKIRDAALTHCEALEIREQLAASGNHRYRSDLAISLSVLGSLWPEPDAARDFFDRAEQILKGLVEEHPTLYRRQWAILLDTRCLNYIYMVKDFDQAVAYGRDAVQEFRSLNRPEQAYLRPLAGSLCNLALAHEHRNDGNAAADCLKESRDTFKELLVKGDVRLLKNLATVNESLYKVWTGLGNQSMAQAARRDALEALQQLASNAGQVFDDFIEGTTARLNGVV